jgi:hypothetical protein
VECRPGLEEDKRCFPSVEENDKPCSEDDWMHIYDYYSEDW